VQNNSSPEPDHDGLTRIERDILRVLKKKADESTMTLPIDYPPRQGKIPGGKAVAMLNLLYKGFVSCAPGKGFTITRLARNKLQHPPTPPKTYDLSQSQKIVLKLLNEQPLFSANATYYNPQTGSWFVAGATSTALTHMGLCKVSAKLPRKYTITPAGRALSKQFKDAKLPMKK
jgi:hypothetical protein